MGCVVGVCNKPLGFAARPEVLYSGLHAWRQSIMLLFNLGSMLLLGTEAPITMPTAFLSFHHWEQALAVSSISVCLHVVWVSQTCVHSKLFPMKLRLKECELAQNRPASRYFT